MIRTPHKGQKKEPLRGGYTLIELMVAVGLFALVMALASGAYLVMIGVNRHVQSITTGINNTAFALESMVRNIRTSTDYSSVGSSAFSFKNESGAVSTYSFGTQSGPNGTVGTILLDGVPLTDPVIDITSLTFYTSGTSNTDAYQPYVTITVAGTVSAGPGKTQSFSVETGVAMRGSDI